MISMIVGLMMQLYHWIWWKNSN